MCMTVSHSHCVVLWYTAGEDYIDLKEEFTLTSSSPEQQCVNLTTLRDNAVEDAEGLTIILVNNTNIDVGIPVHVTIMPADDSEWYSSP